MQQTYVSAYRSLLAGSEPRRADVWLAAIARNECLDRIRTRMREPLAEHGRNGRSEAPDALAALIAGEELRALSRSIEQLPAQQREALVLHEFCGLPYGEVAAAIGVSESAIGSLLFRARRSVRSAFRRGYAVLPLPEIWNASAQLLARGPAIKVAALPMVAKVGCGAVALGLSAGAVVAVDHEVGTQSRPRSVPRVAAAPETLAGARTRAPVSLPVVARSEALASATAIVAPVTSERPVRSSPPRREHRPRPIPTTMAGRPVPAQLRLTRRGSTLATRRHPGVRQEQFTRLDRERRRQRATKPRQGARKVHEAARQAEGRAADTGWWKPTPSSRGDGTGRDRPWISAWSRRGRPAGQRRDGRRVGPIRRCTAVGVEHGPPRPPRTSRAPRPPGQELSSRRDRHERDERPADKFSETRPERRPLVRGRELDRRARASQRGAKQRRRPTGVPAGRDQDDPPRPHLARDRRGGDHIRERRP